MWLWILVIISVAVYAADAFTAVNLLAYNKWTSQVKPAIPFDVAKWIFAVCIILSYAFLAYRWFRAWRVIRSDSVTESYLEPLAAIFNSLRLPSQGWRRFLVYAALTKSRKGVDYLALFVYFQFKGKVSLRRSLHISDFFRRAFGRCCPRATHGYQCSHAVGRYAGSDPPCRRTRRS